MNSTLKKLEQNKENYNKLIEELDDAINAADELDLETLETLEGELASIEKIIYNIKITLKDMSSKIFTQKALKNKKVKPKLKDKSSIEFNEVLLYQGKPARAVNKLESLAKKGDPRAQYLIGKTYLHGVIGNHGNVYMKDSGLGLKWLHLAFKNGINDAGYLIALYERSSLNIDRAVQLLEKLGKTEHLKSLKELAYIYKNDPKHKSFEKLLRIEEKLNIMGH